MWKSHASRACILHIVICIDCDLQIFSMHTIFQNLIIIMNVYKFPRYAWFVDQFCKRWFENYVENFWHEIHIYAMVFNQTSHHQNL
jgi:hypothetical protein